MIEKLNSNDHVVQGCMFNTVFVYSDKSCREVFLQLALDAKGDMTWIILLRNLHVNGNTSLEKPLTKVNCWRHHMPSRTLRQVGKAVELYKF
jgi:hypothetical protein